METEIKMIGANTKEFKQDGYNLVFYKLGKDIKYSFFIENEPELTKKLLSSVKTKRVAAKSLFFAKQAIFEKLQNLDLLTLNYKIMENQNPITKLAETIQALHGKSIETEVLSKVGADHNPTIEVKILLPNGKEYFASGSNKRIAKRKAAEEALKKEGLL